MGDCWLWLLNIFLNLSITFMVNDVKYPFRLNKEIINLISVFSNKSFAEYQYARGNKQVIRPRFHSKDAMLLKCKSAPVKVGLRYTLTLYSSSQIVTSTSRNGSEGPPHM